jgi:hypothetical protein
MMLIIGESEAVSTQLPDVMSLCLHTRAQIDLGSPCVQRKPSEPSRQIDRNADSLYKLGAAIQPARVDASTHEPPPHGLIAPARIAIRRNVAPHADARAHARASPIVAFGRRCVSSSSHRSQWRTARGPARRASGAAGFDLTQSRMTTGLFDRAIVDSGESVPEVWRQGQPTESSAVSKPVPRRVADLPVFSGARAYRELRISNDS